MQEIFDWNVKSLLRKLLFLVHVVQVLKASLIMLYRQIQYNELLKEVTYKSFRRRYQ